MNKDIESAIEKIDIIKEVINKTQKDFSKISSFFIWVGVINLVMIVFEHIVYYVRDIYGYGSGIYSVLSTIFQPFVLVSYIICYLFFSNKMKKNNNEISLGLFKTWGVVLIGSKIWLDFYMRLVPDGINEELSMLWRCKELIIALPLFVVLFMTGILTKSRLLNIITGFISILYLILFTSMKEITYGAIMGNIGTRISVSGLFVNIIMSIGMIGLSVYLRKGVKMYGD